jgi:site-specific DNA-methyltransferase (adenine-specific)
VIICGDCLDVMRGMDAASVDAIVTDPPYGLGFMGKEWDKVGMDKRTAVQINSILPAGGAAAVRWAPLGFQEWCRRWAVEALRVAKPGAHLLAFGGTRTFHRLTCAIEDAGWEIRDCLMYVYGSGFPKSHNLKGDHEGWGTALKPAWEPIILARKPLDGTVAENVQKWGTGAVNVDGCRVETDDQIAITNGKGFGGTSLYEGGKNPGERMTGKGRWPANLLHDGSEEVLELFPQTGPGMFPPKRGDGQVFGKSYGSDAPTHKTDSGSAARFFYSAKASRKEREIGCEGMDQVRRGAMVGNVNDGDFLTGSGNPRRSTGGNHHPTVKPLALMHYLCRLVTPPNGLILDPFMGSGTTLIAAEQEGFRATGIEMNEEYCEIARKRIYGTLGMNEVAHV